MSVARKLSQAVVDGSDGGCGGWRWGRLAAGGVVGAGPPLAPATCARTGSAAGPVAGLSRDLASGIIGALAASPAAGISLAAFVFFFLFLG